jgi:hypothetical protein
MRLAMDQAGVVSRRQLLSLGLTSAQARGALESGHWQAIHPGCYLTHSGCASTLARVWAAVLYAGDGAVAGPRTTAWLRGLIAEPPNPIDVDIPHVRRVREVAGVRVRRRRHLDLARHPAATPPQLRVEQAVLDLCELLPRPEAVVDLVIRAVQKRITTAERVAATLAERAAHRRRALLLHILADVRSGVRSPLELAWLVRVERPHCLPSSRMNAADTERDQRRWRDVCYEQWGVICELDGREAHPDEERFRDRQRDNRVVVSGRITLRYGWHEVTRDPCAVAAEVASVLRSRGWSATLRGCGPTCPLGKSVSPMAARVSPPGGGEGQSGPTIAS